MSNDREFWETRFVDAFVTKQKRSRYTRLLSVPRKRHKILDLLNHNADLDYSQSVELAGKHASSEQLIQKLSTYEIDTQCWMISDDSDLDGKRLPVCEAVELTTGGDWGTIMICPPRPIAVYRSEASDRCLYLFS